jgi:CDP-diacylglycerol pyrophosphatase
LTKITTTLERMQEMITRKVFGKAIQYKLQIEESKQRNQYQIHLSCLQPELFHQMLGNSPALLKNQLVTIVKDAAYAFTPGVDF